VHRKQAASADFGNRFLPEFVDIVPAEPGQAGNPAVGMLGPDDGTSKKKKRTKSRKADRQAASAPAPGFSLK